MNERVSGGPPCTPAHEQASAAAAASATTASSTSESASAASSTSSALVSATDHHVKGRLFIPPEDVLRDNAGTAGTGSGAAAAAAAAVAEEGMNDRRRPFIMVGGAVCCPVDEHVSACHEVVMLLNLSRRSSQSNDHIFKVRFAIACCTLLFLCFCFGF